MAETDESLLKIVNASGFPFQLRVEEEIQRLKKDHTSPWSVAGQEHRWTDRQTGNEAFIDLLLESRTLRMVVECKRVRGGKWIFLTGDGQQSSRRARLLWTYFTIGNREFYDWHDFVSAFVSPESGFCVVRGQGERDKPMLERLAGNLLRSTEAVTVQDWTLSAARNANNVVRVYFPVIITNAELKICHFKPDDVSLETGLIDLENTEFQDTTMVRFRKSLSTTMESDVTPRTLGEMAASQSRTVLVVNANALGSVLPVIGEITKPLLNGWPWEQLI